MPLRNPYVRLKRMMLVLGAIKPCAGRGERDAGSRIRGAGSRPCLGGPTFGILVPRWEPHSSPAVFVSLKGSHSHREHLFPKASQRELGVSTKPASTGCRVVCQHVRGCICGSHLGRFGADLTLILHSTDVNIWDRRLRPIRH